MAYSAPPTFVAGDPLAAAELNILTDDVSYLYGIVQGMTFSGANISHSGSQSISDSTPTDMTLSVEGWDYGGWWTSGPSLTVPAGAIPAGFTTIAVMVVAAIRYASNNTGNRSILLLKNGSTEATNITGSINGEQTWVNLTTFTTVAAGDTLTIQGQQFSGGALNITAGSIIAVRYAPAS